MVKKTYTIKVEEELYYLLRRFKADSIRKILKDALSNNSIKNETINDYQKQLEYYFKSMQSQFKEVTKIKKHIELISTTGNNRMNTKNVFGDKDE
jgi:CCR4-NOT transcriptional regulation complex NOT5 subunit